MNHSRLHKYPRTQHLPGSGLQVGDDDLVIASFDELVDQPLVVEEKMDGANCGVSFAPDGRLLLQSRGHYLSGGPREAQFGPLKAWASRYQRELWQVLGDRYVMYGEWLYAKHTVFYTDLPHYFLEFDVLDTQTETFLDTTRRQALLAAVPFVASVAILHSGLVHSLAQLVALIGPSHFIGADHRAHLQTAARSLGQEPGRVANETDQTGLMEGLYVKVETGGVVTGRYKYVRAGFLQTVFDSGSHWQDRPLLPNRLRPGAALL